MREREREFYLSNRNRGGRMCGVGSGPGAVTFGRGIDRWGGFRGHTEGEKKRKRERGAMWWWPTAVVASVGIFSSCNKNNTKLICGFADGWICRHFDQKKNKNK